MLLMLLYNFSITIQQKLHGTDGSHAKANSRAAPNEGKQQMIQGKLKRKKHHKKSAQTIVKCRYIRTVAHPGGIDDSLGQLR